MTPYEPAYITPLRETWLAAMRAVNEERSYHGSSRLDGLISDMDAASVELGRELDAYRAQDYDASRRVKTPQVLIDPDSEPEGHDGLIAERMCGR